MWAALPFCVTINHVKNQSPDISAPPGEFRVLATGAVFASIFSYAIIFTVMPASINEMQAFYHSNGSLLAWLFRLMMTGFLVATLLGGRYSDRVGKFRVLAVGSALMGLGALILGCTSNFSVAIAATLVMGIGGGFSECISMAAAADLYPDSRRTAVLNYTQVVFAAGAVACPLAVAQLLKSGLNWRYGFAGVAVVCALSAIMSFLTGCKRRESIRDSRSDRQWRDLLSNRLVLWLSLGLFLYVGYECGTANWLAAYFKRDLFASNALAPWSVGVFWLGISAGRMVAAWASKHMADYALIQLSIGFAVVFQVALVPASQPDLGAWDCLLPGLFQRAGVADHLEPSRGRVPDALRHGVRNSSGVRRARRSRVRADDRLARRWRRRRNARCAVGVCCGRGRELRAIRPARQRLVGLVGLVGEGNALCPIKPIDPGAA